MVTAAIPDPETIDVYASDWLTGISPRLAFIGLLVAHTLVWTFYTTIAHGSGVVHNDMLEAFAWGQEFQLGYWKHPPFYSWVVGLWFKLLPHENWAFYFLSYVNSAVGLAACWTVAGKFLSRHARSAAIGLLMLTPIYNFYAMNFNANSILLSIWPWTIVAFLVAIDRRCWASGVLLGLLCGIALLSKYYSVLLLISLIAASVLHPERRMFCLSPAPWVGLFVFGLVVFPHAVWSIEQEVGPISHALGRTNFPFSVMLTKSSQALLGGLAFLGLASIVFARLFGICGIMRTLSWVRSEKDLWIKALAFGPVLLTLGCGFSGLVNISSNFLPPALLMIPIAGMIGVGSRVTAMDVHRTFTFASGIAIVAALFAPVIAYRSFAIGHPRSIEPRIEAAAEGTRLWNVAVGSPLRLVTGSERYALAATFYSVDHPSQFIGFSSSLAPWITPDRLAREGLLIICSAEDDGCTRQASSFAFYATTTIRQHLSRNLWGRLGPATEFIFTIVPPASIGKRTPSEVRAQTARCSPQLSSCGAS
jgi:4-amino-4-deoxy-L-arabinose transferase-like glycosyltransferase